MNENSFFSSVRKVQDGVAKNACWVNILELAIVDHAGTNPLHTGHPLYGSHCGEGTIFWTHLLGTNGVFRADYRKGICVTCRSALTSYEYWLSFIDERDVLDSGRLQRHLRYIFANRRSGGRTFQDGGAIHHFPGNIYVQWEDTFHGSNLRRSLETRNSDVDPIPHCGLPSKIFSAHSFMYSRAL